MLPLVVLPHFNPVLLQVGPVTLDWPTHTTLGPLSIRWYALAYITGLLLGTWLVRKLVQRAPPVAHPDRVSDFLTWATLGVVLGGRLGYVLFYQPGRFTADPAEILAIWDGGMSFHGGMLGVAFAIVLFCRRNRISILGFADRIAVAAPMGLFLGRIANFINGELWGREAPAWLPWAMVFPTDPEALPRHPSQLYEAGLEGLALFAVMLLLARSRRIRARFGCLTGAFLVGYAIARTIGECFRQPDPFLNFLVAGTTMGQLLSLPMLLSGLMLIARSRRMEAVTQ